MNDVVGSVNLVCSIILKCSASIALLTVLWIVLRLTKGEKVRVWWQNVASTGASVATTANTIVPEKPLVEPAKEPALSPLLESLNEAIECGNCHKEIASKSITTMNVDGSTWAVYVCEHCDTQVKVPV